MENENQLNNKHSPIAPIANKPNKTQLVLFMVLALASSSTIGILFYQNNQLKKELTLQNAKITPVNIVSTVSPTSIPTLSISSSPKPTTTPSISLQKINLKCRFCQKGFSIELPGPTSVLPEETTIPEDSEMAPYYVVSSRLGTTIIYYKGIITDTLTSWLTAHSTSKAYDRHTVNNPTNAQYFLISDIKNIEIPGGEAKEFIACYKEPEDLCKKPIRLLFSIGGKLWEIEQSNNPSYSQIKSTLRGE